MELSLCYDNYDLKNENKKEDFGLKLFVEMFLCTIQPYINILGKF